MFVHLMCLIYELWKYDRLAFGASDQGLQEHWHFIYEYGPA